MMETNSKEQPERDKEESKSSHHGQGDENHIRRERISKEQGSDTAEVRMGCSGLLGQKGMDTGRMNQHLQLFTKFGCSALQGIHEKQELLLHPWRAANTPGDPANLLLMPETLEKELSP
ncbi:hypothetical protein TURU_096178 [Turdus rufiventris]|nr:hypothetical protein TURU_096178 [Turdus rufiventris]